MQGLNISADIVLYLLGLAAMWGSLIWRVDALEKKVDKHNNLVERMVALETNTSMYLGGDGQLACSAETAARVDQEVVRLIKEAYDTAMNILKNNTAKLHDLAEYLLEKENISGEEFQRILQEEDHKLTLLESETHEEPDADEALPR